MNTSAVKQRLPLRLALTACDPEMNSRHGDEYWDPNVTKEKFDPVELPDHEVVYSDTNSDEAVESW